MGLLDLMGFLRRFVEGKLSRALGAPVHFEAFKISLAGTVDATGLTVGDNDPSGRGAIASNPAAPFLTVRRIRASLSVARALKKEIAVKSLAVEGLTFSLVRYADGTTNLPPALARRDRDAAGTSPAQPVGDSLSPDDGQDAPKAWSLESGKVQLTDAALHWRDDALVPTDDRANRLDRASLLDRAAPYHLSAEQISGELAFAGGAIDATLVVGSLGRRDVPAELGSARATARLGSPAGLAHLTTSPATLQLDIGTGSLTPAPAPPTGGPQLALTVTTPAPSSRRLRADAHGTLDLAQLVALLPASFPRPTTLPAIQWDAVAGRVNLQIRADYSPEQGLSVPEAMFRLADFSLPPRDAGGSSSAGRGQQS